MSGRITLLIALVGFGAAAYMWLQPSKEEPVTTVSVMQGTAREEARPAPIAVASEAPNRAKRDAKEPASAPAERTVAGSAQASGKWAAVTIAADTEDFARRPAASSMSGKRLSSLRPGDDVARAQLVRDIQYELRRVGCYDGELHGWWSSGTKRAMKAFTDRVNATLPVDEADYILLSLVHGHKGVACGKGCPAGQLAAADGRCMPRAIMAQRKGGGQKSGASVTETATATSSVQQPQIAREPLPGRMAMGAPIAGGSERAEIALEEARRHQQQATLEDRRLRLDTERKARLGPVDSANTAEDARRRAELAALEEKRSKSALDALGPGAGNDASPTGLAVPASAAAALAGGQPNPSLSPPEAQTGPRHRRSERRSVQVPSRSYARKGSTREVFATVMRNAP